MGARRNPLILLGLLAALGLAVMVGDTIVGKIRQPLQKHALWRAVVGSGS